MIGRPRFKRAGEILSRDLELGVWVEAVFELPLDEVTIYLQGSDGLRGGCLGDRKVAAGHLDRRGGFIRKSCERADSSVARATVTGPCF